MKASVNGQELFYRFDGPEDAPIVMMAHAMGASHCIWDWQLPVLTPRFRVLRYDWLGHGDSAASPGPYSLDRFDYNDAAPADSQCACCAAFQCCPTETHRIARISFGG